MRTAAAAGTGARLLLLLGLLASRPSAPRAQIVTLQSPTTEAPSLADQFRLYRWGPEVPPHEWKCWGMGNGARDWRNGDLEGCHMFTAHEANFNGDDIRTLTAAILANGTEITYVDLAGADIAAAAEVTDRAEALRDLLGSPLSLEEMNLEKNGFRADEAVLLATAITAKNCPARLRLGWNPLGPAGAEALAAGLSSTESGLREISLESCAVEDAGAQGLAEALALDPALHTLNLDTNEVCLVWAAKEKHALHRRFRCSARERKSACRWKKNIASGCNRKLINSSCVNTDRLHRW